MDENKTKFEKLLDGIFEKISTIRSELENKVPFVREIFLRRLNDIRKVTERELDSYCGEELDLVWQALKRINIELENLHQDVFR